MDNDTLFKEFCEEGKSMSLGDLLSDYAHTFHAAFFVMGEDGPYVTDKELRDWLNWCVFYGKPRNEYPLANKD
ncbi:hypothetical protein G1C96_0313 [Bifidobacterium sp. DSM 109958]|uniref:Uncharacterized protein n=1 Tax=Bifidobacterium moraviense TaxID=2675323 RepID=A0A7Y0HWY9_9BIFI|nr:hypothetical protein [Bifidobacterium sp. DSM 109958]NMM99735.1 hypothetical protein [Bifidobacterium sp. DSM 109958]